ncbi:hypothetical protein DFH08DRAFT_716862 [Mycena albidolilacea]|uniref:Cellulose-binding protein n=1 Tax=Mycena albidolilacea TaxID=1033008 RepID=A0AAD6ZAQ0_9AGAR|nr:hypothetical protein DFH08DRAFT_716862 [Mycena albidolilacea]
MPLQSPDRTRLQSFPRKPRVFVLSDISNEPDDAESLVRYLTYANQFDTEGLVAVTSTWMKTKTCPQDMEKIVDAYAGAVDNLNAHAHPDSPYPSSEYMRSLIRSGPRVYGFQALAPDVPLSPGSELLLERIVHSDPRPLWVLVWGGTNVLAQVLKHITDNKTTAEAATLRAKLRVYTISDQDDTAPWIRQTFPDIFYISSLHGWNQYGLAAWTGISGDKYYKFNPGGPDLTKMTKAWIKENIQIGPLGSAYPDYMFIPEGDTPTFLYLVQNGLNVPEQPSYGSWGGRYERLDRREGGSRHFADAADTVSGMDQNLHTSSQASIWRWRDAFQNDFAARIAWTIPDAQHNHHPVVCVNGNFATVPLEISAEAGSTITLDAEGTYDPDEGDILTYKWWHYREPTASQWWVDTEVAGLEIQEAGQGHGKKVTVTLPPPERCAVDMFTRKAMAKGQLFHLILEVTDNATPALTSYRRILIQATNEELKGGGGASAEAVGDLMQSFA